MPVAEGERSRRWASEAQFFDNVADQLEKGLSPFNEVTLQRYRSPDRPWFNKEFRIRLLGDLRDKHILDIGCGDGDNAVLLAKLGARVTGIDISPKSIGFAQKRAALNGVSDRTHFICSPLEVAEMGESKFDVIWGDGVLHHLIADLELVFNRVKLWGKPSAKVIFSEPVSLSKAMRRLRKHIPIHTDATPDERPLERDELAVVKKHIPNLQTQWFCFLGRDRFIVNHNFEGASAPRQALANLLHRFDSALLQSPGGHYLASMAVLHGNLPARG
jgi:2-polyprenyl-3-methyl-5-hydroxy-6-metoxy-1,4-benzoquinol methylase